MKFIIMMLKRFWPIVGVVIFGVCFWAFKNGGEGNGNELSKQQQILTSIGYILREKHYSPQKIDDDFSIKVLKEFLNDLDPEKNVFLSSDIQTFKKLENYVDDELNGAELKIVNTIVPVYRKRVDETEKIFKEIIQGNFEFNTKEYLEQKTENLEFASNENIRKDRWRKKVKFAVLERYVDFLNQQEKSKDQKDYKLKSETQLEQEARDAVKKVYERYFNKVKLHYNNEEKFAQYVNVITELMDPHTNYFPPIEKRSFDEDMSRSFYGIGAQLKEEDGYIKIAMVMNGGPAFKSGQIQVNDIILKVAQGNATPVDIGGFEVTDAVKLIRGNKGTEVRLTIKKADGNIIEVSMIREEISNDEGLARSVVINNDKGEKIGYIYLPDFYANFERVDGAKCSKDVAKELIKLQAENVKGVILDLRNNGGGSLYEVIQMVGFFINQGPVVQVKDREGVPTVLSDRDPGVLYDGPLAVMVNEFSASASEIFAAAIQDYNRGIIVGSSSTFGKGTVQRQIPFGKPVDMLTGATELGALKLTFQKFYRVNGGSTQLKGVEPDVVLPDVYEYLKFREKDTKSALPWDEIEKSVYKKWTGLYNKEEIITKAKERLAKHKEFTLIDNNAKWLATTGENPLPLNMVEYKALQEKIKSTAKQNESLTKLNASEEMKVYMMQQDEERLKKDTDAMKVERYRNWVKAVSADMYIHETVKIVSDMVAAQKITVQKN